MGSEIEIKLAIKNEEIIARILDDEKIKSDFGSFTIVSMNADYYDTPDLDLLKHNYVLRIRKENGEYVCTLKKRDKELDSGVLIRKEWNKILPSKKLSLSYFSEVVGELEAIVGGKVLIEILETDFIRRKMDIAYKSSKLELAVDYGKIVSNDQEVPIMEVEIELKEGVEEDILAFIEEYLKGYSLRVDTESKFARGLHLFMKK